MKNFKIVSCGSGGHGVRSLTQKLLAEKKTEKTLSRNRAWNHNFYYTNNNRVELISISGEKGFFGPALGAFQNADHVNIVLDVTDTNLTQTILLLKSALKISEGRVTIVLNKMDKVYWEEDTFLRICAKLRTHIIDDDQTRVKFIPTSSETGGNVFHLDGESQWYGGESVYQTWKQSFLHKKREITRSNKIISLQQGERWQNSWAVHGQVCRGKVSEGDVLTSLPDRKKVEIQKIYHLDSLVKTAPQGACVTLILENPLQQSFLVQDPLDFQVAEQITARIYNWGQKLEKEKSFLVHHTSGNFKCKVHDIHLENAIGDGVTEAVVDFKIFPKLSYQRLIFSRQIGAFRIIDPVSKKIAGLGLF